QLEPRVPRRQPDRQERDASGQGRRLGGPPRAGRGLRGSAAPLKRIRQGRSARGLAACFLIALGAACSNAACSKAAPTSVLAAPADSAEVFAEVGPFELVERGGSTVTRETLLGHPWVASFLFTRCTGPCPKVVGTLRRLQARLERQAAHIVTFSVDPQFDTPEVLR